MPLNNFTDNEAIERVVALRDKLELDPDLPIKDRWADKDALAQVILLAIEAKKAKKRANV